MSEKFVVTTEIVGKKVYVVYECQTKQAGKAIVSYNPNIEDALEFGSKSEAAAFLETINNPYNRVFNVEKK